MILAELRENRVLLGMIEGEGVVFCNGCSWKFSDLPRECYALKVALLNYNGRLEERECSNKGSSRFVFTYIHSLCQRA